MSQEAPETRSSWIPWLTGGFALLFLLLRLTDFWAQSPARATDSYFYALRIRQLGANPELFHSPLLSLLGILTNLVPPFSPLDGYRAYVAISISVFLAGLVSLSSSREQSVSSSLLMGILAVSSLFIFDAHVAYPRQGFAIGLWCCGTALALRNQLGKGIALLIAGSITHVFAAGLALFSLIFYSRLTIFIRVALSVLFVGTATWHLSGHEKHLLGTVGQYGWTLLCGARGCSDPELVEIVLWPALAIGFTGISIARKGVQPELLGLLLFYLALNLLPWSTEGGMAERLAWSSPWIAAILAANCVRHDARLRNMLYALSALLIGVYILSLASEPRAGVPKDILAVIKHREVLKKWITETALVQAPRGVDYFIAYELDRETTWRLVAQNELTHRDIFEIRRVASRFATPCPSITTLYTSDPHTVSCVNISKEWKISVRHRKTP